MEKQLQLFDSKLRNIEPPAEQSEQPLPKQVIVLEDCEHSEKRVILPSDKKPVVLQGMIIAPHVPSESKFEVPVEGLSDEKFNGLKNELEDLYPPIDENWKHKYARGRAWRAVGTRVGRNIVEGGVQPDTIQDRVRVLYVRMFPSSITSWPSSIRTKIYTDIIPTTCFALEKEKKGNQHKMTFILPYSNIPRWMEKIDELNRTEVAKLNAAIVEFQQSRDYQTIVDVLQKWNVANVLEHASFGIDNITWTWQPLSLDFETVKQHVEEAWKKAFGEVDATKKKMIQDFIENDMAARNKEFERCIENLQARIKTITLRISTRRKPERLKEDIEAIRGMALSMGAEELAETVLQPLQEVIDHPEKAVELFGTKEVDKEIEGRMQAFVKTFKGF
jgi:hypothetical protein